MYCVCIRPRQAARGGGNWQLSKPPYELAREIAAHIKSRPALGAEKEALAKWLHEWFSKNGISAYLEHMPDETPEHLADAILTCGIISPWPSREEIEAVLKEHAWDYYGMQGDLADAILALMGRKG